MHKKRTRALRICAVFALVPLMFALVSTTHAAPDDDCAAGRHPYTEIWRVDATATEDGEVAYLCTACGQQYKEILYATDHNWGRWVVYSLPTCTQPGEKRRTCNRSLPHDEYDATPALGHDHVVSGTREPGCEEEGVITFTCTRCTDEYREFSPAIGHEYEEAIEREPSCMEPGLKRFVCAHAAAHSYDEDIPAIGSHSFGEWAVEIPAGEGVEGLEVRVCALDGFRETSELAALPIPVTKQYNTADIVLVTANIGFVGFFAFLIIPYILCMLLIKKRREDVKRRDTLRKEVGKRYGFR